MPTLRPNTVDSHTISFHWPLISPTLFNASPPPPIHLQIFLDLPPLAPNTFHISIFIFYFPFFALTSGVTLHTNCAGAVQGAPWNPDCLGAPGSYRVELIGVTPLEKSSYSYRAPVQDIGKFSMPSPPSF